MPGSSRELAEIFGTSDDEEDMDFPFSLNVDKSFPDLNLTDGRVSEFFLKSINSLSVPVPSMNSALVPSDVAGDKFIPDIPTTVTGNGMKGKDTAIPGVEGVNITTAVENVNAVPEAEGVDAVTGVQRVNTDGGNNSISKEKGVEGVKESAEMDESCSERNEDDIGKAGEIEMGT